MRMSTWMDPHAPEHTEPELDALLRARRPTPDASWVRATQERLFPERRRWTFEWPVARLGAVVALGLAALVLALSLAGVGPLGGNDRSVQAKDDCKTVTVTRKERVPSIVKGADGQPRVVYSERPVQRLERRCK